METYTVETVEVELKCVDCMCREKNAVNRQV